MIIKLRLLSRFILGLIFLIIQMCQLPDIITIILMKLYLSDIILNHCSNTGFIGESNRGGFAFRENSQLSLTRDQLSEIFIRGK